MIPTHTLSVRVPREPTTALLLLRHLFLILLANERLPRSVLEIVTLTRSRGVFWCLQCRVRRRHCREVSKRSPTRTWAEFLSVLAQGSHRYHYNVPACVNTTHLLPRSSMEDLDSDFERSSRELAHPESGTDSLAQGARSTVVAMVPLLYILTLAHRAYLRRDTLLDSTVR